MNYYREIVFKAADVFFIFDVKTIYGGWQERHYTVRASP